MEIYIKAVSEISEHKYYCQQLWVFENIKKQVHQTCRCSSTYEMSGHMSKFISAEFVEIRPIEAYLENLK